MPDNKQYAKKRYLGFEVKMSKDWRLRESARLTIRNHLAKGYIREVETDRISSGWYLPIFAVTTEKKTRLVWDAAAEYEGVSLNGQRRVFHTAIPFAPIRVDKIVVVAVVLHNFLHHRNPNPELGKLPPVTYRRKNIFIPARRLSVIL